MIGEVKLSNSEFLGLFIISIYYILIPPQRQVLKSDWPHGFDSFSITADLTAVT